MYIRRAFFSFCLIALLGCNVFRDVRTLPLSQLGFQRITELDDEDNWQGVPYTLRAQSGDCEDAAAVEAIAAFDLGYAAWMVEIGHYVDYEPAPKQHVVGIDQGTHMIAVYKDNEGLYHSSGMNQVDCWQGKDFHAVIARVAAFYRFNFYQSFLITPEIRAILMKDSKNVSPELEKAGVRRNYYKFVFLDAELERRREENKKRNGIK